MTLNQIISRIQEICEAHKQVRNFYFGAPVDFLTDKTTLYPSAFLQDSPGALNTTGKEYTVGFKLFLLDLVNVANRAKENELEVQSDMTEVVKDLLSEFNHSSYTDWGVSVSNVLTIVREEFDDLIAGAVLDFTIRVPWPLDTCAVPTLALPGLINTDDMKLVYDGAYITDMTEGSTLNIPQLVGKKLLLLTRENAPLHKVSNSPNSSQYTWNDTAIGLGVAVNTEATERFVYLYRNY